MPLRSGAILKLATASLLPLAALTMQAQAQLAPFSAQYSATLDLLIDLPVTATRKLEQSPSGLWHFSSEAKSTFAYQSEASTLGYKNSRWTPLSYKFNRSVFGRKRNLSISFDAERQRITTVAKQQPWAQPYEANVQDKLSYQLQLREDLIAGRQELSYRIADGGKIKTYRFVRSGEETLTTPAGTFDCVRLQLERAADQQQTLIWMAPALDYLTVRLLRVDASGREHFLNLKSLEAYR